VADLIVDEVSRWFGPLVAVNAVSMTFPAGITGLLGPNGAGKSTLITMLAGFLKPSRGEITIDGRPVGAGADTRKRMGVLLDLDATYDGLSGRELVAVFARLQRCPDPTGATQRAIDRVAMDDAADRRVGGYSKGMRQRIRLAAAIVHDPQVLLLDEPFNGMDPSQRLAMMEVLRQMGGQGCTIIVSSHILDEVEQLADRIEVLVAGRHAASGDARALRRQLSQVPHQYALEGRDARRLAAALMVEPSIRRITVAAPGRLEVEVVDLIAFTHALPRVAVEAGSALTSVTPTDDSLESVFRYLVAPEPTT
jgi:ABC-2 type transport system ATP-binding protein